MRRSTPSDDADTRDAEERADPPEAGAPPESAAPEGSGDHREAGAIVPADTAEDAPQFPEDDYDDDGMNEAWPWLTLAAIVIVLLAILLV